VTQEIVHDMVDEFNGRAERCRSESPVHVISGSRQLAGNSRKLY
jgi:hypothetical protein